MSYLNTKPLVYRLTEPRRTSALTFDLPSRLADDLADGRLDVADPIDRVLSRLAIRTGFGRLHRLPRPGA
ncbi:MAG: hypothetical protein R3C99_02725 [Pirellulaceae bacterium]